MQAGVYAKNKTLFERSEFGFVAGGSRIFQHKFSHP